MPQMLAEMLSTAPASRSVAFAPPPSYLFAENRKTYCRSLIEPVLIQLHRGTLSKKERKAYIGAVQCLIKKQAKTPKSLIPGAVSRFDDWVGTHINQTNYIHYTGTFLAWHRYFTWTYEQALRKECGYTGRYHVCILKLGSAPR